MVEKRYLAGVDHPKNARSRLLFQSKYFFRRAKDVQYEAGELGGIRVLWANPQTDGPVLLYFHGGAYQLGAPETHMHW
ncbi:MAG TPA: esterase, partial [Paracoccaceae bacterium]|nr:esterase [Paracoccaceae bacterium]